MTIINFYVLLFLLTGYCKYTLSYKMFPFSHLNMPAMCEWECMQEGSSLYTPQRQWLISGIIMFNINLNY